MDRKKLKFKRKIKELKGYRGRNTELVSVLVPAGYDLNLITNQVAQEQSTASNIKSKSTRKNVETALEKILQRLSLFKRTPERGLAIYCGNIGEHQEDWVMESIIPPEPLQARMYRCDQTFLTEPLEEMLEPKVIYGLIVIERGGAALGLLKGKRIEVLRDLNSMVPGKFRAGGQSAQRFERVRDELANDFYKQVESIMTTLFKDVGAVLLGGPGPTKEEFYNKLPGQLQDKIVAVQDIGYSGEFGLRELVEKSEEILQKTEMVAEKRVIQKFMRAISKGDPVEYGLESVEKALKYGAVETLILSENVSEETMDSLSEKAGEIGADVEIVSTETDKGKSFDAMGGIGALLRYEI